MSGRQHSSIHQSGFSMIEILVTLIILLLGLLGLVGVMVKGQHSEIESYQRVQALILLQDMAGRINANRNVARCYAFTTSPTGTSYNPSTPYVGTAGAGVLSAIPPASSCTTGTVTPTAQQQDQFNSDLTAWNQLLLGAAETFSGSGNCNGSVCAGAMVGARGCVSYDASTELVNPQTATTITGSGIYTIAVAWQGLDSTAIATSNCAQGLYGSNDAQRRVVSLTLRMASLTTQ